MASSPTLDQQIRLPIRFGSQNAGSAAHKGALIDDLICDYLIDDVESLIRHAIPFIIKKDITLSDFSILYICRPQAAGIGRSEEGGCWWSCILVP